MCTVPHRRYDTLVLVLTGPKLFSSVRADELIVIEFEQQLRSESMVEGTNFYGTRAPSRTSGMEVHLESLHVLGYSVMGNVLNSQEVDFFCALLDRIYKQQEDEFSAAELEKIGELDVARCLLAYDDEFLKLATHPRVLEVVQAVLGTYVVLHLQNGIICRPGRKHHQAAWHRDLPYQRFTSSRPLALNAYFCLCDYSDETGGTMFLPFSHRQEEIPSLEFIERHAHQPEVRAGSVIFFDSMIFHRAGSNSSDLIRRGINQVFTTGIIKQQIDLPTALGGRFGDDSFLKTLLGYASRPADNVRAFRTARLEAAALK